MVSDAEHPSAVTLTKYVPAWLTEIVGVTAPLFHKYVTVVPLVVALSVTEFPWQILVSCLKFTNGMLFCLMTIVSFFEPQLLVIVAI